MHYSCLVADDNLIEQDLLTHYLAKVKELQLAALCSNGKEAVKFLKEGSVDIVFSDINMPGISGISLLKGLENPPVFVFITSYAEYAAESFNLDVVDFVIKPLSFERFFQAATKAMEYVRLKRLLRNQDVPQMAAPAPGSSADYFFIKQAHGITRLCYNDVLYIESMGDFSKIFLANGEKYVALVGLKNLQEQLPIFLRVHRQYMVNINRIVTITAKDLLLDNKQYIPVGELYRQALMDRVVDKKVIGRFTK